MDKEELLAHWAKTGVVYRPRFGKLLEDIVPIQQAPKPVEVGLDELHKDPKFLELIKRPIPGVITVEDEPMQKAFDEQ